MSTKNVKAGLSKANVNAIAGAIGTATLNRLVPIFSTSVAYEKGQYTNYNNQLYRFTANKSAGAWDSSKVESASLNDLIHDVNEAVASVTGKANTVDLETGALIPAKAEVAQSLATTLGKLDRTPFAYMSSGGQTDIETGIQKTLKLTGVNVVKNQLVQNGDFASTTGWATNTNEKCTFAVNNNVGTVTIVTTDSANRIQQNYTFINGHKYYVSVDFYSSKQNKISVLLGNVYLTQAETNVANQWNNYKGVVSAYGQYFRLYVDSGENLVANDTVQIRKVVVIDLTQRYGNNDVVNAIIGSDTSKQVERLLQFDPNILKDTSYDLGTMVTVKTAFLKSDGYNVWDEEVEVGGISTTDGSNVTNGNYYRSKNYTRVKSGVEYYVLAKDVNDLIYAFEYDINKNLIKYINFRGSSRWTLQPNTAYLRICNTQRNTYQNNVSIFEYWDGSRIGYEPHEERIEPMPNVELHGILKVDEDGNVYADGDELYADHTNNKRRYGIVDLGSLSWTKYQDHTFYATVNGIKLENNLINYLCPKYVSRQSGYANDDYDKMIYGNSYSLTEIIITDSAYNNAATFKTAMSGVYLIYELAEEQELEANDFNENLWADDFGHLQCLDEDGNEIVGLQGVEILYRANVAGFAESLYERAGGEPSDVVIQEDLEPFSAKDTQLLNALGGTLRQCLCVKESLDFDNTAFVDLGTLNWNYASGRFYTSDLRNIVKEANNKGLCTLYARTTENVSNMPNLTFKFDGSKDLNINDTTYTDVTAFKNAMKGVLLAYEKVSS